MIAFYSTYGSDVTKILRKHKFDIELRYSESEDLKDRLLDIDLRKTDKFQANLIDRDLDFLDNLSYVKKDSRVKIKLKSKVQNNSIYTEPLSLNAIVLMKGLNVISFDLSDILKALAFRHLHYEFGYNNSDIEDSLSDSKLIIRNKPDALIDLVNYNIDSVDLLKDFKISEKSYISGTTMYDHFCNKVNVTDNTYNSVLDSTFNVASLLCAIDISEQLFGLGLKYLPIGISSNKAYFLLDKPLDKSIELDLVLEVFGRRFRYRVKPSIEKLQLEVKR